MFGADVEYTMDGRRYRGVLVGCDPKPVMGRKEGLYLVIRREVSDDKVIDDIVDFYSADLKYSNLP
jgi:hypothetical protein